jgi:hypothetical protein
MRRWLPALALLLAACGPPSYSQMPDQAAATNLVWVQQYGITGHAPPAVAWVTGGQLNCANGQAWMATAGAADGGAPIVECVAGLFDYSDWLAQVAWPAGNELFSATGFAHELCHALEGLQSNGADHDYAHTGPCFQPNGGYVATANAALAAEGL